MFGKSFITVMHDSDDDLDEIVVALGGADYVETKAIQSFGKTTQVSIFKAATSTANEKAQEALWYVTNVFPSKGAALAYIREKEQYT